MATKTQAFILEKVNAEYELKDIELDEPGKGEVLVEIVACGLCHTDLLIQNGAFPSAFPNTTGHEGSGKVLKVGEGVTRVSEGDSVLLSFASCMSCKTCKRGEPAACQDWVGLNFGRVRPNGQDTNASMDGKRIHGTFFGQSAFARHALVVESSLVKVPHDTDLVTLSPLGCGLQTGSGAIYNVLKPKYPEESSIVIFGAGAVGMSAVFAAKAVGMKTTIIVDLVDKRLELAKELGATHSINGKDKDLMDRIKEITGTGADYTIEATGAGPCVKAAWDCLGMRGSMVQLGTPGPGPTANLGIHDAVCATKTYYGTCEGGSNPPEFIPKLVSLYKAGKFPVDRISKVYSYKQFDEAVHAMHDGTVIKPIIDFTC